jgi:uracil-DNA glycosylase family 4
MEEFDEKQLQDLIEEALSDTTSPHPFGGSASYLGLAETDLMQVLHERLSKRFIDEYINDIFQESRTDFLSRKISTSIKDVHTITKNCKKCAIDSNAELPKWNVQNPDIAVVVDSPSISPEAISLMVTSFKKAGLSSDKLCLTYVNRCPVKRKYENSEVINCSPYLHLELQLLNPKLILCLGGVPSSVLFGTEMKIKTVRGQVMWLGYWPIMTTYSPAYVLKSSSFEEESNVTLENFQNDIFQAYDFVTKKPSKKMISHDN